MYGTISAISIALAAGSAAPAVDYRFGLTSRTPGTSSGMALHVAYGQPGTKPPGLDRVAFELPPGLRLDTSALPRCTASDDEIRLLGQSACPAESRIGQGTITAMTGIPGVDPFRGDTVVFNGDNQVIEVVNVRGTGIPVALDRLKLEDGWLVAHPPAPPGGPPDGRTTVQEITLDIEPHGALITTPPSCPPEGVWTSRFDVRYASYPASLLGASTTPCDTTAAAPASIRVQASPPTVRARRPARLRVIVTSVSPSCREGVRVRLGGRTVLTDDGGRATLRVRFAKPGRRTLLATKAGCRSGRAALLVRRAAAPRR